MWITTMSNEYSVYHRSVEVGEGFQQDIVFIEDSQGGRYGFTSCPHSGDYWMVTDCDLDRVSAAVREDNSRLKQVNGGTEVQAVKDIIAMVPSADKRPCKSREVVEPISGLLELIF